jgi:hypothetical protein
VLNVDVSLIDLPRRGVLDDPTIQPHEYFQFSYLTGRKSTNVERSAGALVDRKLRFFTI